MALDTEQTKNSLFGNIKKQTPKKEKEEERTVVTNNEPHSINSVQNHHEGQTALPKWQRLDRFTVLLDERQKQGLDQLARKIMKYRAQQLRGKKEKERLTTNSIIRALIDLALDREHQLEMNVIEDEEGLKKWLGGLFR